MTSSSVRRHKATGLAVLLVGLLATGFGYAAVTGTAQASAPTANASQIEAGKKLYLEGCATCHGLAGQGSSDGPSLIGVGAAAVDFQVKTGRMPLAQPTNQAPRKAPVYNDEEIAALAAFVASLGAGPAIPTAEQVDTEDANLAEGGELFRTNCAQCHNFAGKGAALTHGKYAPSLMYATQQEVFEAMLTGPQNMPVFGDGTLTVADKQDILAYVGHLQDQTQPGGFSLGSFGPVTEGAFLFTVAVALMAGAAVWIGARAR